MKDTDDMKKISVSLQGHRTSFSLEPEFLALLKALAETRGLSLAHLVGQVDQARLSQLAPANLSSALRLCVLRALADACLHPTDAVTPLLEALNQNFGRQEIGEVEGADPVSDPVSDQDANREQTL